VSHHHPDLFRAAVHRCHDEADHCHDEVVRYHDEADHCCQNPGAAGRCCRHRDAADDHRSVVCCRRNLCAVVLTYHRTRDVAAYRQNPDAAVDHHLAAGWFRNHGVADDHRSAAYFQNPCAEADPKTPDVVAHHQHPVAAADGDRSAVCCSVVSRPAPSHQNPDAADDLRTA
jgi:hypothetical protein